MTLFERQKIEIKRLNSSKKIRRLLQEELGVEPNEGYLSNPDNFKENTFYHYTNSLHDKRQILKNGFDVNKVRKRNKLIGKGLYLGRDKDTLMGFYDASLIGDENCIITIIGTLNFLSLLSEAKLQKFLKNLPQLRFNGTDIILKSRIIVYFRQFVKLKWQIYQRLTMHINECIIDTGGDKYEEVEYYLA